MNLIRISKTQILFLSLVWILLAIFALGAGRIASLKASTAVSTYLVCPSGPPDCDYDSIQDAVDAAGSGDLIKVAEGTYSGVYERSAPSDYDGPDDVMQMVYLTKTITIRGGYTTGDWSAPDPAAHPTTLDAQGLGRVLFISGDIAPVIEGLRLTGGDASDLGGTLWADAGGGIYVQTAAATISDCLIFENAAASGWSGTGGGLFLISSPAVVRDSTVRNNVASSSGEGYGGGLALDNSDASISGNAVYNNTASTGDWGYGGGIDLFASDAVLVGNEIYGNSASTADQGYGGGIHVELSDAELTNNIVRDNIASTMHDGYGGGLQLTEAGGVVQGNTIKSNVASKSSSEFGYGGGLDLLQSSATLKRNVIQDNSAGSGDWGYGGGLSLTDSNSQLVNNAVIDNQAGGMGAGLTISGTTSGLTHTTIARNSGGDGSGLYLADETALTLTNTIIAGQKTGIYVEGGSTAVLDSILWYDNTSNSDGGGTITVKNATTGNPAFTADGYHIQSGSAAIDAGTDAKIGEDIDGEPRPYQIADLGADEQWPSDVPTPTSTPSPTPVSTPDPNTRFLYLPVIAD